MYQVAVRALPKARRVWRGVAVPRDLPLGLPLEGLIRTLFGFSQVPTPRALVVTLPTKLGYSHIEFFSTWVNIVDVESLTRNGPSLRQRVSFWAYLTEFEES